MKCFKQTVKLSIPGHANTTYKPDDDKDGDTKHISQLWVGRKPLSRTCKFVYYIFQNKQN